ncbi:carbonic anhydrase-related protein 10-like isoform X2 [Oratosquilla oratoria]|uniref:carbonic anhydrase-related protein 10-like isoform X2 n=1 Tax=Oratosquilla oratoria TaxID=337810 RepID=UPI003F7646B3
MTRLLARAVTCLLLFFVHIEAQDGGQFDWSSWWSYDGISGPAFWGVINRKWRLCSDGRRQSPVDVQPGRVVYDHTLGTLSVSKKKVSGSLTNTGSGIEWVLNSTYLDEADQNFDISGGPLHYRYRLANAVIRWSSVFVSGESDSDNSHDAIEYGSEHSIDGEHFPAEIQLYFYNTDLYSNMSHASGRTGGVAAVSTLVKVGWQSDAVLQQWTDHIHLIPFKGKSVWLSDVPVRELFPSPLYLTYEGSTTTPPCEEGVAWILFNKPVYITAEQLWRLQTLRRGAHGHTSAVVGNVRPVQPLYGRALRTNIPPFHLACNSRNQSSLYQASRHGES